MLVENNFDIKKYTSFKIGGRISKVLLPETLQEFEDVLKKYPAAFIAGNLSNTLVSSDGYDGVVIVTSKINQISVNGNCIIAGCGVKGQTLSKTAKESMLSGLEFMSGFPGSVGGEVFMNAGANGTCIADVLKSAKVFSKDEGIIELSNEQLGFEYRKSVCQKKKYTVLEAKFELKPLPADLIDLKIRECLDFRKNHQPSLALPNCGSIFKNPENNSAGKLLDSCGVKSLRNGDAYVWKNHANFIVNGGNASSVDVLELMLQMYTKVKEKFNIELEPEIKYLGGNNKREAEICTILKIK